MKKIFTLTLVFSLLLPVLALGSLNVEVKSQEYCMSSPAEFNIKVTNHQDERDIFSATVLGRYRSWSYLKKPAVEIYPQQTKSINISLIPPQKTESGKYYFEVVVYSNSNSSIKVEKELCLAVLEKYSAKISQFKVPEKVKPGKKVIIDVEAYNIGAKDFEELKITGTLKKAGKRIETKENTFPLKSDAKAEKHLAFSLDKFSNPGTYIVELTLKGVGKLFDSKHSKFEVEKLKQIEKELSYGRDVLSEKRILKVKNVGNVKFEGKVNQSLNKNWALLVSTEGNVKTLQKEDKMFYIWDISLNPGESVELRYQINYWPLIIIFIVIILICIGAFLWYRSPFIYKRVLEEGGAEEEEKEFTIAIEILNRTGKKLKDTVVRDFLPSLASVKKEFKSIKPKIREKENGTELVWRFEELLPGDERLMTYKIKTQIGTIDHFKLPKARLRTKTKDGKTYEKFSGKVKIEASE